MLLNDGDFCHDGKVSRDEFVHMMKMPEHKRMLTTAAASKDQDDLENMARCYLRQEIDPKMATPSETVILRKTGGMRIGFRLTEVHVDGHRVVFVRNVQTGTIAERLLVLRSGTFVSESPVHRSRTWISKQLTIQCAMESKPRNGAKCQSSASIHQTGKGP